MSMIGMIGLGQMGLPMSANLMKAGYTVVGYRRHDCPDFKALGGVAATSAREVAERCEIIFCCIPGDDALDDVISGERGIAAGNCSGRIVVELSTLSAAAKKHQADVLAAKGGVMLDCAISGLPRMVEDRMAVIFASGDEAVFDKVRPNLDVLTTKLFFMGPFGCALSAKLCANMLVAINIASTAEMLAFGEKLGIDSLRLVEALKDGAGGSLQFTARAARMATGDWKQVMGSTATLTKDVHLIEQTGVQISCPTPILTTTAQLYDEAMSGGYAQDDVASVYAIAAKRAGLRVPGKTSGNSENV